MSGSVGRMVTLGQNETDRDLEAGRLRAKAKTPTSAIVVRRLRGYREFSVLTIILILRLSVTRRLRTLKTECIVSTTLWKLLAAPRS